MSNEKIPSVKELYQRHSEKLLTKEAEQNKYIQEKQLQNTPSQCFSRLVFDMISNPDKAHIIRISDDPFLNMNLNYEDIEQYYKKNDMDNKGYKLLPKGKQFAYYNLLSNTSDSIGDLLCVTKNKEIYLYDNSGRYNKILGCGLIMFGGLIIEGLVSFIRQS